ncbi:FadR family transcriptional regulator [Pseudonocardiaceae bacterium YIM PH 21723]|nr:FadR family transcriptional regulator [Pseudonocardiaceae bacterium YIM PH 21723]
MEPWRVDQKAVLDAVFEQLLGDVADDQLAPGEPLPSEDRIANRLGASPDVVREALRRLMHSGLVETDDEKIYRKIRFTRKEGGLELLPKLLFGGGRKDFAVARGMVEARLYVSPQIAAMAAARSGAKTADALDRILEDFTATEEINERQRLAMSFWQAIADAADSVVFRLMLNNIRTAYEPFLEPMAVIAEPEMKRVADYRAVADAIIAGDEATARRLTEELITPASEALIEVLRHLEEHA